MPQRRRANGTFARGAMPEDAKRAISEGQARRHARVREGEVGQPEPERKRCTQCGEWKDRKEEFPQRRRELKSGVTRIYPAGECSGCQAERSAAYREKLRQDGTLAERQREWNSRRDREERNRYQREYGATRRRQKGAAARGPWKKYRGGRQATLLDPAPLLEWLEGYRRARVMSVSELTRRLGVDERDLRRWRAGQRITLAAVDQITSALERPELAATLYPLDAEAKAGA